MKFALLAASLGLAAAAPYKPSSGIKFVDLAANTEFITFVNGVLTVPQHCRADTCTAQDVRLDSIEAKNDALQAVNAAQANENAALHGLIAALRSDLTALATTHGDDIAASTSADSAFAAADAALTAAIDAVSKIEGPQGEAGADGAKGDQGITGDAGADGADGLDGQDGKDGKDGKESAPAPTKAPTKAPTPAPTPITETEWRIVINTATGNIRRTDNGNRELQLDEVAFLNADQRPTQTGLGPVTSPNVNTAYLFCGNTSPRTTTCMNNDKLTCNGDSSNLDFIRVGGVEVPPSYTYTFSKPEAPRFIRIATCDSADRMAKLITPQFKRNGKFVSCNQIDTGFGPHGGSPDEYLIKKHGSSAFHNLPIVCCARPLESGPLHARC